MIFNNQHYERGLWIAASVIAGIFFLSCNCLLFGHYIDDVKWVLLSESFLKFSVQTPWLHSINELINWGTSLFLVPVIGIAGRNLILLKIYMAALLFSGLVFFFYATRKFLAHGEQYLYLTALTLNGFILSFTGGIISETPYLFLFGAGIYLLFARDWLTDLTTKRLVTLSVITSLLILTRTAGVIFFMCLVVELLLSRRIKQAAMYAGLVLLGIAPYFIFSKFHSGSVSFYNKYWHLALLSPVEMIRNAAGTFYYYWKGLTGLTYLNVPALFPGSAVAKFAAIAGAGVACLYSFARLMRRDPVGRFLIVYFVCYALLYTFWSYRAPRYILPLYPVFIYLLFTGISYVRSLPARRGIFILLAAFSAVSNAPSIVDSIKTSLTSRLEVSHTSYEWLKTHSADTDLIISMDIARIYYYTGRSGLPFVPSDSLRSFIGNSRRLGVKYYFLRQAGFTEASGTVRDPIVLQYDRFNCYMNERHFFSPVYRNEGEGVAVYTFAEGASFE